MSDTGNFAIELAEARVLAECDASVARVRASLAGGAGASHCVDCGEEIPEGRRRAVPSASKCVNCASGTETGRG